MYLITTFFYRSDTY